MNETIDPLPNGDFEVRRQKIREEIRDVRDALAQSEPPANGDRPQMVSYGQSEEDARDAQRFLCGNSPGC